MSEHFDFYKINTSLRINEQVAELKSKGKEQRAIAQAILDWHNQEEFTFMTSGSTGAPKKIEFSKNQIIASILQSQQAFDLTKNDVALLCLPMRYVAGKMMLYRVLHIGMNLIAVEPKLNLMGITNHKVTFAAFIPSQVESLLSSDKGRKWLESIRIVIIGGAAISVRLESQLRSLGNLIYHTYGMTETLTHVALRLLSRGGSEYFSPLPRVALSISIKGTLKIDAQHLGVKIVTNDVVELKEGDDFTILGRIDNVINSGGLKIHPEALESVFKKYISHDLIVVGNQDEKWGERVVLIIESDKAEDPEWIAAAKQELPNSHWPKEIRYVSAFERTETGKILRKSYSS